MSRQPQSRKAYIIDSNSSQTIGIHHASADSFLQHNSSISPTGTMEGGRRQSNQPQRVHRLSQNEYIQSQAGYYQSQGAYDQSHGEYGQFQEESGQPHKEHRQHPQNLTGYPPQFSPQQIFPYQANFMPQMQHIPIKIQYPHHMWQEQAASMQPGMPQWDDSIEIPLQDPASSNSGSGEATPDAIPFFDRNPKQNLVHSPDPAPKGYQKVPEVALEEDEGVQSDHDEPELLDETRVKPCVVRRKNPSTGLYFNSLESAEHDCHGPEWRCPKQDRTIPRTNETKAVYVRDLVNAMMNQDNIEDKLTGRVLKKRWTKYKGTGKSYYNPKEVELVAWRIIDKMVRLHVEGPNVLSCHDVEAHNNFERSKELNFRERYAIFKTIAYHFKSRVDKMMRNEGLVAMIANPQETLRASRGNRNQNDVRQECLHIGRNHMNGERERQEQAEEYPNFANDPVSPDQLSPVDNHRKRPQLPPNPRKSVHQDRIKKGPVVGKGSTALMQHFYRANGGTNNPAVNTASPVDQHNTAVQEHLESDKDVHWGQWANDFSEQDPAQSGLPANVPHSIRAGQEGGSSNEGLHTPEWLLAQPIWPLPGLKRGYDESSSEEPSPIESPSDGRSNKRAKR